MFNSIGPRRRARVRRFGFLSVIKYLLIVLVPCILWVAINRSALEDYVNQLAARNREDKAVRDLRKDVARMEVEKKQLETHGFADEATARERLRLAKPGEKIKNLQWEDEEKSSKPRTVR